MNEIDNSSSKSNDPDVSILQLFSILWKRKFLLIGATFFIGIFSVIFALSLPVIYQSKALLSIQSEKGGALSSLSSQLGGLASIAGIQNFSSGGDKTGYAVETIKSRSFLKELISKNDVVPEIIATKSYIKESKKLIYDDNIFDAKERKWLIGKDGISYEPSYLEVHDHFLKNNLHISVNDKTGFINISIDHISPYFAQKLLSIIIDEINSVSKEREIAESQAALNYLNEQRNTPLIDIKDSINNLIESQLNKQMIANIKDDFLLKVLDPPYIPELKVRPNRALICVLITFFGSFSMMMIILLRDLYFSKNTHINKFGEST